MTQRSDKPSFLKRLVLLIFGLFLSALGVALLKNAALGVSPISSAANIVSIAVPELSLGTWLIIWNCVLIWGQFLILRRDFRPVELLQLPLSVLFGLFTDLSMSILDFAEPGSYIECFALVVLGTVTMALGISLTVIADVIMNSGEALVKAVSDKTGKAFGSVKIAFDACCVALAVALSFILCGEILEVREGTLVAALLTGVFVNLFGRLFTSFGIVWKRGKSRGVMV